MLCCVGLVGGAALGQSLGGPWTFIPTAVGFGIGLVADMKIMNGHRRKAGPEQAGTAAALAGEGAACCSIAPRLRRMLGLKDKNEKREMTLAEIRKTYLR